MTDRDLMALLAEANPVQVDDLAQVDFPNLARRRSPRRLLVVAAAAVVAAGAAASIAVFAFPSSHPSADPGPGAITSGAPWQTIALSDASTALGAPVVLPNTDFVRSSDAAPQARTPGCSADSCAIFVSFPAQSLGISYTRPAPFADPRAQWAADVQTAPKHHAEAQLVDLNGVPGDYIEYPGVKRLIQFVTGGTWIVVGGPGDYDKATLQTVAQSIVDQESTSPGTLLGVGSPPSLAHPLGNGKQVSLAEAAQAFGGEIVQPDTPVVSESDAGAVWLAGDPQVTNVAVTYPRADVWVTYTWPVSYDGGYDDRLLRYHANSGVTHTALLDGVPAQVVFHSWKSRRWSSFYPSVHFAAGGVNIAVEARQDKTALEAIARSIVDRSEAPPAGQLGNVAGVQVYPYLGHGKQISLSEASGTLGSPVVLPDSPLAPTNGAQAWAEGTCPHPDVTPATTEVCAVWISFPGSNLSVGYIRPPAYLGTGPEWRLQARGLRSHGSAVRLDGVAALSIHRNPGAGYPGRVELDLAGTRIVVAGDYAPTTLQAIAQSIVDRSHS